MKKRFHLFLYLCLSVIVISCNDSDPDPDESVDSDGFDGPRILNIASSLHGMMSSCDATNRTLVYGWEGFSFDETCQDEFSATYYDDDTIRYLLIELNHTEPGIYLIPEPGTSEDLEFDGDFQGEKTALVHYVDEAGRHNAYSGTVEVTRSVSASSNILLKVEADFPIYEIQTEGCEFMYDVETGVETWECDCVDPDGTASTCTSEDGPFPCCPDLEGERETVAYELESTRCEWFDVTCNC